MPALPRGEPRSRCEFVCSYAQSKLVSPSGRDVAQRQRGLIPADMAFPICFGADLLVFCPLSHLLRKCQLSQRESRETGAGFFLLRAIQTCLSLWERCRAATERACICWHGFSNLLWCRPASFLPSQSFASQMPALPKGEPRNRCEFVCSYAQSKLVSPFGRDVAQRQRGLIPADMAFQICPDTGFFVFRTKQKRAQICTLFFGGRWWIRTTEVVDNRFTVCPLWPLGKPPISTCRNRGAGGRT